MAPSSRSRTTAVPQSPPEVKEETRKRVQRACDACRIKKAKCDGDKPCLRCANEKQVCTYTQCKKPTGRVFSSEYVELLESKVNLLTSSLSILVTALNKGEDVSRVVQVADSPINEVVERLQAMNPDSDSPSVKAEPLSAPLSASPASPPTKSVRTATKVPKATRPAKARPASSASTSPGSDLAMSPTKHIKIENELRSPIYRTPGYDAPDPSIYMHKSPTTYSETTGLDFSDSVESPTFDEPASVNEYPSTFGAPLISAKGFRDTQLMADKYHQNPASNLDTMLSSPPYTYADNANARKSAKPNGSTTLSSTSAQYPMAPPSSYPNSFLDPATPISSQYAPSIGYGAHTPPFALDSLPKDDLSDYLADKGDLFTLW